VNYEILEWIPYNRFKNIECLNKGRFSTIYKAIWLDGHIIKWSDDERKWDRYVDYTVTLKSLKDSSNLNEEILNKV